MAIRSTQPALYEKMRGRPTPSPALAPTIAEPINLAPVDDVPGGWIRPGRVIRLPVGYILLAAALTVTLVVAAYMIGHGRGEGLARADYEKNLVNAAGPSLNTPPESLEPISDPTSQPLALSGASLPIKSAPKSAWGPVAPKSDPRKKGLSYFVLAATNQAGAVKLADFCRSHGLETYVVPDKNKLLLVIAFPGFDSSVTKRSSPEVRSLEERIHEIGTMWQRETRDVRDLHDAYPSKYGG